VLVIAALGRQPVHGILPEHALAQDRVVVFADLLDPALRKAIEQADEMIE
jgi:hypothetical protein